ncbi:hypothetical protein CW360_00015 [Pseudomonas fluvialis]|uniref:Uncharacterized protein n=1 Tax=Pseudomonas fluvialis TaxID=1793966 RepID=A0A2I0CUU8_9PSED|nr:hypothetical protein [Pseudomonas pharmacofabricae]PKF71607.1 hypothetical protein CW360_07730 [Pseudomonas pharmacofabricae]PKF73303.1 hypothetical protein CW360_00015 [Pseudomonas pharmacofabricae]
MRTSPLYRSVNTRTHGVKHGMGGEFRHARHSKSLENSEAVRSSMHSRLKHGRDYTPLFRFLLSRVGDHWNQVYAEAKSRLDTTEPIFWLVARSEEQKEELVRVGESSYFSGLFVDGEGLLQLVNSSLRAQDMEPFCTCCTHTFNGVRFGIQE